MTSLTPDYEIIQNHLGGTIRYDESFVKAKPLQKKMEKLEPSINDVIHLKQNIDF